MSTAITEISVQDTKAAPGHSRLSSQQERILERVRIHLNQSLARKISKAVDDDPAVDFEKLLQEVTQSYRQRLLTAQTTAEKRAFESVDESILQRNATTLPLLKKRQRSISSVDPIAVSDLSPRLLEFLCSQESAPSSDIPSLLRNNLDCLIDRGKMLFAGKSRTVLQLSDDVVVKFGRSVAPEEQKTLRYVGANTTIPVPEPLGTAIIGKTTYLFMTFLPGETLERCWHELNQNQKVTVRSQLDQMLIELRSVPRHISSPLGTLSSPHVCKILRMSMAVSPPNVRTVSEFHDFFTSNPLPGVSEKYTRWLRSLMRDDCGIILSHGDFHMRNILVTLNSAGEVFVSGIIDWEMGGWYPEYWEMCKAFHTRSPGDDSDWWNFLPESILGYDMQVLLCRMAEHVMKS